MANREKIVNFLKRSERGFALLLVLGALILISIILVGFLATVRQDRVASAFYENGSGARQYADTAVSMAIAQIADATSNPTQTWISQPGLLRTFDASGQVAAYKLYSSDRMKITGSYDPANQVSTEVPSSGTSAWYRNPDEFVDLNSPVQVMMSGTPQMIYPIVDPGAADPVASPQVEGFSFNAAAVKDTSSSFTNSLPMPVRWIYVRRDGSLVDYNTAQTSRDVVARLAFWTDDETSKVNINTASDGVFYDSPAYMTAQDYWLGVTQPVAQEYQRFPGHPSTTSLAAVLQNLRNIPEDDLMGSYPGFGSGITTGPAARSAAATLITPRISTTSLATPTSNNGGSNGGRAMAWLTKNPVLPDSDRLYAGLDELSFGRNFSDKQWNTTAGQRYTVNLGNNPERLQFFMTTDSRAPELTLFNRPRITLWPFNTELLADSAATPLLTPEDRLIRFASEIGKNRRKLYFQRENAWDPAYDYTNITENKDLYAYLQWSTRQPDPSASSTRAGAGNTLESKYTVNGRDQILTEMFDYIRSQVNTLNVGYKPVAATMAYSFPQNHLPDSSGLMVAGFNDICPLMFTPDGSPGVTKGIASPTVISEVLFQFYNAGEYLEGQSLDTARATYGKITGTPTDNIQYASDGTVIPGADGKPDYVIRKVQMVCLLNLFQLSNNLITSNGRYQVKINGSVPFGLSLPAGSKVDMRIQGEGSTDWRKSIPDIGFPSAGTGGTLDTTLICAQGGDDAQTSQRGGSFGLAWAMMYPQNNYMGVPFSNNHMKTLSSVGGAKTYYDNSTIPAGSREKYQIYPFVSKVIEFRIPYNKADSTMTDVSPFAVASSDEPIVNLIGQPLTISVYPGLMKTSAAYPEFTGSANSSPTLWPTTGTPLMTTVLNVQNCTMPLPRLVTNNKSPDTAYPTAQGESWQILPNNDTSSFFPTNPFPFVPSEAGHTGLASTKDMQSYPVRFRNRYKDYIVQIPRRGRTEPQDVIRAYHLNGIANSYGDLRLAALTANIPSNWWVEGPGYSTNNFVASSMVFQGSNNEYNDRAASGRLLNGKNFTRPIRNATGTLNGALRKGSGGTVGPLGDFTVGYGSFAGGAAFLGPDTGAITYGGTSMDQNGFGPYYSTDLSRANNKDVAATDGSSTYFMNFFGITYSPWKQMPSAVAFGTLPSRSTESTASPWETLLFCPNPAGGATTHRGWMDLPRDHYWLDLFYMPVVEPYAITENFATNGKINMNSQIAPFTYITRQTGLYALLRNMQISAVPNTDSDDGFKPGDAANYSAASKPKKYRYKVDVAETLKGFNDRFAANDPFVSASEICEMFLVPQGTTYGSNGATVKTFWANKDLTGDDKRESPYNAIYPRVTTRSNTFKVHFIAQTLKGQGALRQVVGQYRGSQIVERYLDISRRNYNSTLKGPLDTATGAGADFPALAGVDANGNPFYRFRKLSQQQFAP